MICVETPNFLYVRDSCSNLRKQEKANNVGFGNKVYILRFHVVISIYWNINICVIKAEIVNGIDIFSGFQY